MGYVQGMSYVAAMLLLFVGDALECFRCFANMLNSHFFFGTKPQCTPVSLPPTTATTTAAAAAVARFSLS